jgi:hypothetical protein
MTEAEVDALPSWGKPAHVSTFVMAGHTHESWVYDLNRVLVFQDGRLALINVSQ